MTEVQPILPTHFPEAVSNTFVVLVFYHTIPSLIPFESTQMEIKINIKYLPLKALKVYNDHIHVGKKPVLKLHWRLSPSLLRPINN